MNKTRLLLGALLVMILITGCAGGSGEASNPDDGNDLKAQSHMDLGLEEMAQEKFWATLIGLTGTACFLIALFKLFKDESSALKWAAIMMAVFLWFVLGAAVMDAVENAYPDQLNQELVDDALGRTGTVHETDYSPWSKPFVDVLITIVCAILQVTHGLVGLWFMLLPVPWVVENWLAGKRMGFAAIGAWIGFFLARCVTPQALLKYTQTIQNDRARVVGGLPGVSQAVVAAENTANQLNIRFMAGWGLIPAFIFVIFIIMAAGLAFVVGPTVGRWVVTLGREAKGLRDQLRREGEEAVEETREGIREAGQAAGETLQPERTMSVEEYERRLAAAEAAGIHPEDVVVAPSGVAYPRGAAPPQAASAQPKRGRSTQPIPRFYSCPECGHNFWTSTAPGQSASCFNCGSQIPHEKSYRDEDDWRQRGGGANPARRTAGEGPTTAQKVEQAGTAAEVAGGIATVVGAPEVGIPLAAAGGLVKGVVKSSEDQDPDMANRQSEADQAVTDFAGEEV